MIEWLKSPVTERVFPGDCGLGEQAGITRCAEPLYRINAFHPDASSQTFTWDFFASKSSDYFHLVCQCPPLPFP